MKLTDKMRDRAREGARAQGVNEDVAEKAASNSIAIAGSAIDYACETGFMFGLSSNTTINCLMQLCMNRLRRTDAVAFQDLLGALCDMYASQLPGASIDKEAAFARFNAAGARLAAIAEAKGAVQQ